MVESNTEMSEAHTAPQTHSTSERLEQQQNSDAIEDQKEEEKK